MNPADYLADFVDPDPRYSPVPAWWWSGEPLHWPKMKWQMERMRAMGLRNFVVIGLAPGGAMFGSEPDEPPFLSEPWWEIFGHVCDHAKSLGMFVWFYDQIGFSGANFQTDLVAARPEWSGQRLKSVSVEGADDLTATCPEAGTPVAAYFIDGDRTVDIEVVGRTATVLANRAGRLRLVYAVLQAYDYFNAAACDALLDTVHREFARRLPQHLGTTIVGSFQDELPELPTWGPTFADSFAEAFGYRLEAVAHRLFEPGDADARQTRVHYHQHRADLAEAAFFRPFFEWHQLHNLQCGYDQQSPAREARVIGCVEKYADYMQTQKWYALPGSDLHGNGKLHASIAFLNDRPRVWLEGFHTSGWGGTIADTFDWLLPYLQAGVTLYNPHAVYYSTRKGWWEWAPPSTCWRQPYAMHYAGFADTIARLTKLLSRGVQQASVGLLFPTATAQSAIGAETHFEAAGLADATLHEVLGSMRWHQVKTGALDAAAIDHHVLDEPSIQRSVVGDGTLTVHGVALHAVVLPAVTVVQDQTLNALTGFASRGGRVVVVGAEWVETTGGSAVEWASIDGVTVVPTAADVAAVIADLPRPVRVDLPFLHRRDGGLNILFVPAAHGMATVVQWDSWFAPMEHTTIVPERYRDRVTIRLADPVDHVYRFDPVDGRTTTVPATAGLDGTTVDLSFDGAPMAVLVWSTAQPAAKSILEPTLPSTTIEIPADWSCEYVPTLPTDFADIYDPARPEQRLPTTPAIRWARSDSGECSFDQLPKAAEPVLATFGPRGWIEFDDGRRDPLVYSPQFGIDHDKLHQLTLGPKSHVPEEFIDLGKMQAGAAATVRFGVTSDADRTVGLQLAVNADWRLRFGHETHTSGDAYAKTVAVELKRGDNHFDWALTARSNGTIRGFWCLLDDAAAADRRPERLVTPEKPAFGQRLRFVGRLDCPSAMPSGTLLVATAAMAVVSVDGVVLGRQGGFDPYRLQMRGLRYPLPSLTAGGHEVCVEIVSPTSLAPVAVDLEATAADGSVVRFVSDSSFTVAIDGRPPVPVAIHKKQDADGAAWHLRRRPHPLPATAWLDGGRPGVIDLPLLAPIDTPATQWFEWTIPPGAKAMRVPLVDAANVALWVDGDAVEWSGDGTIDLPGRDSPCRSAVVRVDSRQLGGGVLGGAVTYDFARGRLRVGSWTEQGLFSYSGAIRMKTTVDVAKTSEAAVLDLGRVRGTVEAFVNGRSAGVRFMAPYRFDIGTHMRTGRNEIELVATNTLVNHLSTWSPTRCWSPDQLECGVFGPVRLLI